MKKKLALICALAACIGMLATGCGSNGGSGSSGGSSDGSTLSMMVSGTESDAYTQAIKDLITEFNESNEYGVTIEAEYLSTADYKTKLATLMASDSAPDIFYTYELSFLENYVNGDKVADLQSYLDEDTEWAERLNDSALNMVTYDGDVYAIPYAQSIAVMYYNSEIFEQYGLSAPTTYDEYLEVCQTLLDNGVTPVALASTSDDAWLVSQYIQQLSNGIAGYELFESLSNGTGSWGDAAFVEAAELFQAEIDAGYFEEGFTGVTGDEARLLFTSGQAAMYFNGSWEVPNLTSEDCGIADVVDCFAMPAVDSANANISLGALDGSFAISKSCSNVDAAVDFLKQLTSDEWEGVLLYDYGKMPATNMSIDTSKSSYLCQRVLEVQSEQVNLTPWLDRVDTDLGNEFNNKGVAIANGDDAQQTYDDLAAYAEANS